MSYKCDMCKKTANKKEKCNSVVTIKRSKEYYETYSKIDRVTRKKTKHTKLAGTGWEIVKEIKVCNKCFTQLEEEKNEESNIINSNIYK